MIQKFAGGREELSSERLSPALAALHGGLSNLVYGLGAAV